MGEDLITQPGEEIGGEGFVDQLDLLQPDQVGLPVGQPQTDELLSGVQPVDIPGGNFHG